MKFLLGTKQEMTQVFDESGNARAATPVKAGPLVVTQVKTEETDGYRAIQVGFQPQDEKDTSKAEAGHTKGVGGPFKYLREYRLADDQAIPEVGDTIDITSFEVGDTVDVSGTSKGKGFQGPVKRHGFAGGPRTHGQKHSERGHGSIGATGPHRVMKGQKMAGRMGNERSTVQNLSVLHVDADEGVVYISGAVPGKKGTLLEICPTVKGS